MKKTLLLLLIGLSAIHTFACSTFLLSKDGHHVFGRNYDWVTGNGLMIVNARGVIKTSFVTGSDKSFSWTSRYGSITFNQFGKEFPHGGMNEKGLVIELMWLAETNYPAADKRSAISELQWIQYQLDNYSTIQEVIASDKIVRISRAGAAQLHFLIADASGQAATIEFINGKTVVHSGKNLRFPVLTNTVYQEATNQYKSPQDSPGPADFKSNSVQRFATACNMLQEFKEGAIATPPVDYAFQMLHKVSQKGYTRWSIVYDITNREISWITDGNQQRKKVNFNDFEFTCAEAAPALALNNPQTGKVSGSFEPLSFDQNKKTITQSARESGSRINDTPAAITAVAEFFRKIHCKR